MMEKIVVKGGRKLEGTIRISGAKNAALPIIAASLLTKEKVVLHNVPRLGDIDIITELARSIGAKVESMENTFCIRADKLRVKALSNNPLAKQIRYSTLFVGALLPRFREIQIPLPGGCVIGTRRLDSHILGLTKLAAKIDIKNEHMRATTRGLQACNVAFEFPSVSATENFLIAACLAKGTSVIENAAREPEIADLANFLNSMGADINGAGTDRIKINGVEELAGTDYTIMPDRIETGTYIVAAAITKGKILLENADLGLLNSVVSKLKEAGVEIKENHRGVYVASYDKFHPLDIITEVYPGFPTDMQPIITPLLSVSDGESTIKETIFDQRFTHVLGLRKMGAELYVDGDTISVKGVSKLKGTEVEAMDIRAGGALILAGLIAKGSTTIGGAPRIFRGYEKPLEKLKNVGAKVYCVNTENKPF